MDAHDHVQAVPEVATVRLVWEAVDQDTVRVTFRAPVTDDSDGVPVPVEVESSRTVAVALPDLDEAMNLVVELAMRDGLPVSTVPLRMDDRTPVGRFRAIALCITDWWRFHRWFPKVLRELEQLLFHRLERRMAEAVIFRLRALASEVAGRHPPHNHLVIRLE